MITITGIEELKAAEGQVLGTSDWHDVTQADVDAFADVTGDDQWIHVDVERAKETPFGGTIAHGYYTLSLAPMFMEQVMSVWMGSDGHCANILNPNYNLLGVGYANVSGSSMTHYWTQVFARKL